jgi:hypothetical protein
MNEQPESFWKKIWNRPRYFFLCLALFPAAVGVIGVVIDASRPHVQPPLWLQTFAQLGAIVLGAGVVIGLLCFVLAWIPPVNRLLARALQRRWLVLACLITLVALFYAEENFRGKWRWEHFKSQGEAKGEKFDLASFVPPSVPDDQNFAMTPLFRPVFDYTSETNHVQWGDTNGLARLERLQIYATADVNSRKDIPSLGNLQRDRFIDVSAWGNYYRGNTNFPQASTAGTAAQDILAALGKFDTEMAEVQKAALTRPLSRFPIHYDEEPSSGILLPHLARIKSLCQLFVLRAIARLEAHQPEEALADLQTAFRLSDSVRDEPILIDHLVRIATLTIVLQGVREGLVRHSWNDAQLAAIEKYLASLNLLADYKKNMRGERAFNVEGLDYYRRLGFNARPGEVYSMSDDGGVQQSPGLLDGMNLTPGGWYFQNMTAISRIHQDLTLAAVDEEKHRVYPAVANSWPKYSITNGWSPYNIFAKILAPAFGSVPLKSARIQTYVDAARLAVALERYRLANGKLPDTLDALAPALLATIPTDVIDGKPLRYRPNADGSYVIYSIGWNQTDDGGIIPEPDRKGSVDRIKDDWVWRGR